MAASTTQIQSALIAFSELHYLHLLLSFDTFLRHLLAILIFHIPDCGDDTETS